MGKKVLIVGGVAGGASAAARMRRLDETAQIILFERGEYISYANCGLPYFVGGVIADRDALLLQTPEDMRGRYRIDVRVQHEVKAIHRDTQTVDVLDIQRGTVYSESYDALVLAPGSSPLLPPIPGRESDRVLSLWTVPDTDRIRAVIKEKNVKSAVVVGGGFIGLEMAENLRHLRLKVSVVEMLNQVMAPFDYEMAQLMHQQLTAHGVDLTLDDGVDSFTDTGSGVIVRLKSGKEIATDLVILSIGVRPNGELAKAAGLNMNARGGIITDDHMRTSDPAIYAVGDAVEVTDFVTGQPTMIPLAGPANKQGRIAADNIAGGDVTYKGTQGAAIVKLFDLTAASLGTNEKALTKGGRTKGTDYDVVTLAQNSHAIYYPGASPLTIKLIFSLPDARILGAQIVGWGGVDKRIDTLSVAMRLGATAVDLKDLEMAYAPPYSSAKDPVNMLGFMAENVLTGKVRFAAWDALDTPDDNRILLDVREGEECAAYAIPDSLNIPLGQLRANMHTLDRSKEIIVLCAIGVRAYNASRLLMNEGFQDVKLYPGGTTFYSSTHYEELET